MSPLEDCCYSCPGCSRPVCRELGEECHHDDPLCTSCCERGNHIEGSAA